MRFVPWLLCAALCGQTLPLAERIGGRTYPSVFQAWSPADNLKGEDRPATAARHDLLFTGVEYFGLRWNQQYKGLATGFVPESLEPARRVRAALLQKNPHMVMLAEIRYRDAGRNYLPEGHKWWKRGADGQPEKGWEEGGYLVLDYGSEEFRRHVAAQARAAVESGVFDGVMLDWWKDDDDRLALAAAVRQAIGPHALILVNSNDRTIPRTAPYVNGLFMECYRTRNAQDWERIEQTLRWAEAHLRAPRINALETWYRQSREDLELMRATTALSLVCGDGYALFSDPNPLPTPDHLHNWYGFWEKSLGRPLAKPDGGTRREFERGTVVFNRFDAQPLTVEFAEPRRSAATGSVSKTHRLAAGDGDLFLR